MLRFWWRALAWSRYAADLSAIALQKERLKDPAERRAFANAVLATRQDWIALWRRGEKHDRRTNVGSRKLKERARLIDQDAAETNADRA